MSDRLVQLLTTVLGQGKKQGSEHYNFKCPVCKHPKNKLAVQVVPNAKTSHAWRCFHCETVNKMSGKTIKSLLRKIDAPKQVTDEIYALLELKHTTYAPIPEKTIQLPPEFVPLYKYKPKSSYEHGVYDQVLDYLINDRKITFYDILKHNIGMCVNGDFGGRVIIPSYDSNNKLNFFTTRAFNPNNKQKHKNPDYDKTSIIPFESIINFNEPIILVEGAFDAITVKRNAIPLLGKTISEVLLKKLLSSDVNKIYVCLDNDARKGALIQCEKLMKFGKEVYFVDIKDKDPNEMGFEKITNILQNTYSLNFSELLKLKLEATR